jgi:hypothetical protein
MSSPLPANPLRSTLVLAREALYVTVGAGVLAVQRAQVQRREWERELARRFSGPDPAPVAPSEPGPG